MTSAVAYAELCPGCLTAKGTASICPHCGYDESLKRGPLVLPHRALLHQGQYLIGKVLGKPGGFGITYLALDTKLETRVAIKEYLPRDLAGRDGDHATISAHSAEDGEFFRYGLTQFLQEARTLAKFDHANIVRVRNFFEENGTGYLVMDYYDGITLADYLAQQPQGKLPEKTAVGILMPILDGLREVHAKNFLHRDIKPQNIYLTTGNRPILLDFGAARQAMGERSRSISVVLSEGYAPYEQYHRRGEQGPWTDIYACAAVLYHAVAGEAPPPATERMSKDELDIAVLGVSASLADALQQGLAVDHNKRPQRMTEFQALLMGSGAVEGEQKLKKVEPSAMASSEDSTIYLNAAGEIVAVPPIKPAHSKGQPSGKSMWWVHVLVAAIALVIVVVFVNAEKGNAPVADVAVPDANLLSIVSSSLEADPERESLVALNAVLRNRAPYAQAFPNLQLTLTDNQDRPVARRYLLPAEYLPPSENGKTSFLPNREFKVRVYLNTSDLRPAGYKLVLFYSKQDKETEPLLPSIILLATPENTSVPVAPVVAMKAGKVFKDCPDCPDMVLIPAGNFEMGSNDFGALVKPVHRVTISSIFALSKTEVTQGQWRAIMGNNPSAFKNCGDNCPVENVSWNDAQVFIQKLNTKTGKQYRLPSEAEWEYACRAGGNHSYCGSNSEDEVAWHGGNSGAHPHPVGGKQANAFGLYDMSGNVQEWVEDSPHDDYIGAPVDGSAWHGGGANRLIRGGAWQLSSVFARATDRGYDWNEPANHRSDLGFRLAMGARAEKDKVPTADATVPVVPKAEIKIATKAESSQSYLISTNGTEVTDKRTGLIWRRCAEGMVYSGGICTGTASRFTYNALLLARSTGSAWRIPNKKELSSIIDKNFSNPMIDPTAFPATPSDAFWSVSPDPAGYVVGQGVDFGGGGAGYVDSESTSFFVRLVRAGQ